MFPKLLKNAKLEDMEKENPVLLASIAEANKIAFDALIATEYVAKSTVDALQLTNEELTATMTALTNENTILLAGIKAKQTDLAVSLSKEGKSVEECLSEIDKAAKSLESFEGAAPAPAGSGSSADSQTIDTKEKAIDATLLANPGVSRANAISMARRQYPDLFVNQNLLNHNGKR